MTKTVLSISETARRLSVSVDSVRELDRTGHLVAERTPGGHRRFDSRVVESFLRLHAVREQPERVTAAVRRPSARAVAIERDVGLDVDESLGDPQIGWDNQVVRVRSPARSCAPATSSSRRTILEEHASVATGATDDTRLRQLKQRGVRQIPLNASPSARSAAIEVLEQYVTDVRFAESMPLWDCHAAIDARVAAVLEPFERAEQERATAACKRIGDAIGAQCAEVERARERAAAEARRSREDAAAKGAKERKIQDLVAHGRSYAQSETTDWDVCDRLHVRAEIERALDAEVEADWRRREVKDLVNEILDAWGDPDEGENPM